VKPARMIATALGTGAIFASTPGVAQDISLNLCVAAYRLRHEAPQTFAQIGSVTCPASRLGGFPPREIKSRRTATVSFVAPDGMVVDDRARNAPGALSADTRIPVSLSADKTTVSAPVTCESAGIKAGAVTASVTITGQILNPVSDDLLKEWLLTCALRAAIRK
jgi:hypothetical protein